MQTKKTLRKNKIRKRIRKRLSGTSLKPRLSVYRSNKDIYAQIIDDDASHTLIAASSREKEIGSKKTTKVEKSKLVGISVAKKAVEAGIKEVVFDRGGNLYHGRIKAVAEGAREGGLKF